MVIIPLQVDTNHQYTPWANWVIMGVTILVSVMAFAGAFSSGMILDGWGLGGLLGHMLLHGGLLHLAGNMLFLWVFGNTVCGNTGNVAYLFLYPFFGIAGALAHLIFHGGPMIGASGAIFGVVGMALAMYPLNRVDVVFWLIVGGKTQVALWMLAVLWFIFDVWGVLRGYGTTAYWAHIGGFLTGLGTGILAIEKNWLVLGAYDNEPLMDILLRKNK